MPTHRSDNVTATLSCYYSTARLPACSLISLLQDASPDACSFYGYAHELRRHSLLHCTACSDGYKAAARSKLATASGQSEGRVFETHACHGHCP